MFLTEEELNARTQKNKAEANHELCVQLIGTQSQLWYLGRDELKNNIPSSMRVRTVNAIFNPDENPDEKGLIKADFAVEIGITRIFILIENVDVVLRHRHLTNNMLETYYVRYEQVQKIKELMDLRNAENTGVRH